MHETRKVPEPCLDTTKGVDLSTPLLASQIALTPMPHSKACFYRSHKLTMIYNLTGRTGLPFPYGLCYR
jgi:hypothetical protein